MGRAGRLTEEQRRELWMRWKRGETLAEIGRALARSTTNVFNILRADDGGTIRSLSGPTVTSPSPSLPSAPARWTTASPRRVRPDAPGQGSSHRNAELAGGRRARCGGRTLSNPFGPFVRFVDNSFRPRRRLVGPDRMVASRSSSPMQ